MKNLLIFLGACFVLMTTACKEAKSTKEELAVAETNETGFTEEAELEAIMAVIDKETKCFYDGNYACWASAWAKVDYAIQSWNNSDGTANAALGWEQINAQGKKWTEEIYKSGENIAHPDYKRQPPKVKFFTENVAFLYWEQYNADKEKEFWYVSQDSRVMEKMNGEWKIVNVSSFWGTKPKIPTDSLAL